MKKIIYIVAFILALFIVCVIISLFFVCTQYSEGYNQNSFSKIEVNMKRDYVKSILGNPITTREVKDDQSIKIGFAEIYSKRIPFFLCNYFKVYIRYDNNDNVECCMISSDRTEAIYCKSEGLNFVNPLYWKTGNNFKSIFLFSVPKNQVSK